MEGVSTGFANDVYDAADNRTKLSTVGVGDDLEFLNGVDDRGNCIGTEYAAVVIEAVRQEEVTAVALPVDCGEGKGRALGDGSGESAVAAIHTVLSRTNRDYARSKRQKRRKVAPIGWKVVYLLGGENGAQVRTRYFELLRSRVDAHNRAL